MIEEGRGRPVHSVQYTVEDGGLYSRHGFSSSRGLADRWRRTRTDGLRARMVCCLLDSVNVISLVC